MLALSGTILTVGWVLVWFAVMFGGVAQILRNRSGAGALLGGAAILGLAIQLCGGGAVGAVTTPLSAAAGPAVGAGVFGLLMGCGHAAVMLLLILGAVVQRPAPPE